MVSKSGVVRASGESQATEEAAKAVEEMDEPMSVELPEEREVKFRTPGFSRMRTKWRAEDEPIVLAVRNEVEQRLLERFGDAYEVMNQVYDLVRTPEVDPDTGEIARDRYGFVVWSRTPAGSYDEDFTRLTHAQKEHLLFVITTRLWDWHQRAGSLWGDAMLAKAQFEERFAIAYDGPMRGTIEDRTAKANMDAREERYFAIFLTMLSRRADAMVRSLELLAQRIKDSMGT